MSSKTDSRGNIVTKPAVGWTLSAAYDTTLIIDLEYYDSEADAAAGKVSTLAVTMNPDTAAEFAAAISRSVKTLALRVPPDNQVQ